jgi:hypothetical protein
MYEYEFRYINICYICPLKIGSAVQRTHNVIDMGQSMLDEGMLAPQMQTLPKSNGILPHKHATKNRRSCLFPGLDVGWQAWNVTSNEEHFMDRLLIWHWSRYQPLLTHPDSELCFVIRCDMILNGFRNARKPMNSTIECGHGAGSSGQLGITTRKHMTSRPSTSARRILVLNWQWGGLRLCLGGERSDRYCTKRTVQSFLCYLRR